MSKLACKIPSEVTLAISGGCDSMFALNFLILNGKRKVKLAHFNHGTEHGKHAEEFVRSVADKYSLELAVGKSEDKLNSESDMRSARMNFFNSNVSGKLVTAHHLGDAVEWWLFTSFRGDPKLMPVCTENRIKPFLLFSKKKMIESNTIKGIDWIEDETNSESKYSRNRIRNEILPQVLKINAGIEKTIRKKYLKQIT